MTRTSRLTAGTALVVLLVLGVLGSSAVAVWTSPADGDGATRSASLGAPTNVVVAPSTTNPRTSLSVTWSAPSNQLPGASYVVKRTTGGGAATTVGCSGSPCTDSGLTAGTTYTYVVTANLQSWVSTAATASGSTAAASVATTTSLVSDSNPAVVGQLVTYTATVSTASGTPTGNVAFAEGGATISACGGQPLAGGRATCSVRYTSAGSRSITASFVGSTGYDASASAALNQRVDKPGTTTTVTSSQSPAKVGAPVTLTAAVKVVPPGGGTPTGGSVAFRDGSTTISGCGAQSLNAAGEATCATSFAATGARTITAVYTGDTSYTGSTSTGIPQRVVSANVSALLFGNVKVGGSSVTPTCTLTNGTYSCSAGSAGNNAVVTADPQFVSASGSPTVYASDAASAYAWSVTGKNALSNQSGTIAAGQSTGATITGTKNGTNPVTISVTFSDGVNTFNAHLTLG